MLYLCIVFFIVLDLRLTKVWELSGAPFFILYPALPGSRRPRDNMVALAQRFSWIFHLYVEKDLEVSRIIAIFAVA